MKRWMLAGLALLLTVLTACTPSIYGVPQTTWDTLSEPERLEAMRVYQERQIAYQRAAEEQARLRALELERQQAREADQAQLRRQHAEAIHRGEGVYGDLLRVRLQGGEMKFAGKHRGYQPVAFKIAEGESRQLAVVDRKGRTANLQVTYDGGTLVLDGAGSGSSPRAARLLYAREWREGKSYPGIASKGPLALRGVEVYVEIAGRKPPSAAAPAPVIIIQQPQPPPPPTVIIRQPASPPPPTVVIREPDSRPRPPRGGHGAEQPPAPGRPARADEEPGKLDRQPPAAGNSNAATAKEKEKPEGKENGAPRRVRIDFRPERGGMKGRPSRVVPATFFLHEGETRNATLNASGGSGSLVVSYRDGVVLFGENPAAARGKASTARLPFEQGWHKGRSYWVAAGDGGVEVEIAAADDN